MVNSNPTPALVSMMPTAATAARDQLHKKAAQLGALLTVLSCDGGDRLGELSPKARAAALELAGDLAVEVNALAQEA